MPISTKIMILASIFAFQVACSDESKDSRVKSEKGKKKAGQDASEKRGPDADSEMAECSDAYLVGPEVNYDDHIAPLIGTYCTSCHTHDKTGTASKSFGSFEGASANYQRIYAKISDSASKGKPVHNMSQAATDADVDLLVAWEAANFPRTAGGAAEEPADSELEDVPDQTEDGFDDETDPPAEDESAVDDEPTSPADQKIPKGKRKPKRPC